MDLENINQEIQIIYMRLNVEDKPECIAFLEKSLKKLNFQKEIAIIQKKIEQLN
jgi:hypothetical protein